MHQNPDLLLHRMRFGKIEERIRQMYKYTFMLWHWFGEVRLRCFILPHFLLECLQQMRSAGIYLIQADIAYLRYCSLPHGEITITFRVGRSSASTTFQNSATSKGQFPINILIQLNVDSTALQAQRCSLTLNGADKHMLGIALISLPKEKNLINSTYRVTQNQDKRAEVQVKIKISLLQASSSSLNKMASQQIKSESSFLNTESVKQLQSKGSSENLLPKILVNNLVRAQSFASNQQSNINVKSKISEEYSQVSSDGRKPKSFKVREEDRIVQTTESELKRLREEKEAYYQLYQIQKGKNEVAVKFISNLLKRIMEKCPSLASMISDQQSDTSKKPLSEQGERKGFKNHHQQQQQQQADSAMIAQLEQANRSLHRQVDEYKKLVEQMKLDIVKPKPVTSEAKYSANLILPGLLDLSSKSIVKEKASSIKLTTSSIKQVKAERTNNHNYSDLKEVDFHKWVNLSIGQREAIQSMLEGIVQKPTINDAVEKKESSLKKLKAKLDKSFTALLAKKDLSKDSLLGYKKEVNKLFEEVLNF